MKNKPLLSIAIYTYNRAVCLENLLNNIVPQVKESEGMVEICISNNGSKDNTREVVMNFKEKYPGLIKYNENEKNLGADRNMLKVIEMSKGNFIWTFGDDDSIVEGGLDEIIKFIKKTSKEDTGLIIVRSESYFVDEKTGQKIISRNTFDKNKPEIFKIDKKDIIGLDCLDCGFISSLLFNNNLVKKILKEDKMTIEKGIGTGFGTSFSYMLLFVFMFLKYPHFDGIILNKKIVCEELVPRFKVFIEDKFRLHYKEPKKLYNLLLSYKYMNNNYAPIIIKKDKKLRRGFIIDMLVFRAFKNFNYFSYLGCLRLFFQQAIFIDALLFSFVFSILFLIPPVILISLYKVLLIIRYGKKWRVQWFLVNNVSSIINKGTGRKDEMFNL